jgi:hypothetical protein
MGIKKGEKRLEWRKSRRVRSWVGLGLSVACELKLRARRASFFLGATSVVFQRPKIILAGSGAWKDVTRSAKQL